jgi:regulator of protease activity HflC (stomatin/prohibitin superfamily)
MQASNNKPGVPSWAIIGYAILTILIAWFAYRVGSVWLGHAVLITLTFVATWFVKPVARPLARALWALTATTLLLSTFFILFLNALLGGAVARASLSILVSLVLSLLLLGAAFYIALYISSEWMVSVSKTFGATHKEALRLLYSMFFHTNYPWYTVEEGEIKESKPKGLLPKFGGPGKVVIRPYNALVFERGGDVTRIEGPGLVLTERLERPKAAIDLQKQWLDFSAENVLTKDHVPLVFHCGVGFRIESREETSKRAKGNQETHEGSRFPGVISGDYPVYRRTIYKAVYGTTTAGWKLTTKGATESTLREVVRKYALNDIYRLAQDALAQNVSVIDQIRQETHQKVSEISTHWGATVTGFMIKSIDVPADVRERLNMLWAERYEKARRLVETEATTAGIVARGQAEANAIREIEKVKLGARYDLIDVLTRTILAGHPQPYSARLATRLIDALENLSSALNTDTATATRYIEALEKMAGEAGTKVLIIGEERHLLPPLVQTDRQG